MAAAIESTLAQASRDGSPQSVMPELVTLIGARAGIGPEVCQAAIRVLR